MSGMVGIVCDMWARSNLFTASITALRTPPNTEAKYIFGSDRIVGRNRLAEYCVETGQEWLLFLDDDHAFGPDLLMQLLSNDKDVVASLYMQRVHPFSPIAYKEKKDNGKYVPLILPDYPEGGLVEIVAAGTGGMLIKSEVFRALEKPWFEHGIASEDLLFCDKARKAGFDIYCDLEATMGHIMPIGIWPWHIEEEWSVGFNIGENFNLHVGIEQPEE